MTLAQLILVRTLKILFQSNLIRQCI